MCEHGVCGDFLYYLSFAASTDYHSRMNVTNTNGTCLRVCVCAINFILLPASKLASLSYVGINAYARRIILRRIQQRSCDTKVHRKLFEEEG